MLRASCEQEPLPDKLAHRTGLQLGLDKVIAIRLQDTFVCFGSVHDQDLLISESQVAIKGCSGKHVAPDYLFLEGGGGVEDVYKLAEEGEVVL